MDKDVMKRLITEAGILTLKFRVFLDTEKNKMALDTIEAELGLPFFVKPTNAGSSVGIHKVKDIKGFKVAVADAFLYDRKIVIEEYIQGREIECAVLGNENPKASLPGEIIPQHEFYSYEAKYLDEKGALLKIPAKLSQNTIQKIQELAIRSYQVLGCEGMARVDFFLKDNDQVYVNELNTIHGFTKISMYPKMWESSGISYSQLIHELIQLALDRFKKEKKIKVKKLVLDFLQLLLTKNA